MNKAMKSMTMMNKALDFNLDFNSNNLDYNSKRLNRIILSMAKNIYLQVVGIFHCSMFWGTHSISYPHRSVPTQAQIELT